MSSIMDRLPLDIQEKINLDVKLSKLKDLETFFDILPDILYLKRMINIRYLNEERKINYNYDTTLTNIQLNQLLYDLRYNESEYQKLSNEDILVLNTIPISTLIEKIKRLEDILGFKIDLSKLDELKIDENIIKRNDIILTRFYEKPITFKKTYEFYVKILKEKKEEIAKLLLEEESSSNKTYNNNIESIYNELIKINEIKSLSGGNKLRIKKVIRKY